MPSSVRSSHSETRRHSLSMQRVALLGHFAGINSAELDAIPLPRADSPLTELTDRLKTIYGASSIDSMTAVVSTQLELASEPERRGRSFAATDEPRTPKPKPRSHSRTQRAALMEQMKQTQPLSPGHVREELSRRRAENALSCSGSGETPVSRPPISHPNILHVGRRAASEAAVDTGRSTDNKRKSVRYVPRRQYYVTPDWAAPLVKGTSIEAFPPVPPMPDLPAQSGYDKRRASTATITPESYANEHTTPKTPTPMLRRRRGGAAKSVSGMSEDDTRSAYSIQSAATISHYPRDNAQTSIASYIGRQVSWKPASGVEISHAQYLARQQTEREGRRVVTVQGTDFEIMYPDMVSHPQSSKIHATPRVRPHPRPLSVYIPPSQEPASSFSVLSCARTPSPPSPTNSSPSPISSRSARSPAQSLATSSSRSSSPARGSLNPANDTEKRPSIPERAAKYVKKTKVGQLGHRVIKKIEKEASPPPEVSFLQRPRKTEIEDIASWQCPTQKEPVSPSGMPGSFAQRAGGERTLQRNHGHRRISAFVPAASPTQPTASLPSAVALREQESREMFLRSPTQNRQSLFSPADAPVPGPHLKIQGSELRLRLQASSLRKADFNFGFDGAAQNGYPRAETPPSFAPGVQRTDSLFIGSGATRAPDGFFPAWTRQQDQRQPMNQLGSTAHIARSISSKEQLDVVALPDNHARGGLAEARDSRRGLPSQQ